MQAEPPTLDDMLARWASHYGLDGRGSTELWHMGERLVHNDPESAEGWAMLGRAAHLTRNTPFAAMALEKAAASGSEDPTVRPYLARILCELGRPDRAGEILAGAPDGPGLDFARGVVALALENPEEALACFEAAADGGDDLAGRAAWATQYLEWATGRPTRCEAPFGGGLRQQAEDEPPHDAPVIAILDYKSPDLGVCSSNLGDYIQTAAVMRQLAQMDGVKWTASDPGMQDLMFRLRPSAAAAAVAGAKPLHLTVLDRDVLWPAAKRFEGRTVWALTYGWFFHETFATRGPFPAPENIEPIVFSFHLATPDMLRPEVIAWLKRYEPIGCRDWTTVGWLLNQGVEAFFTGCVTTTFPAAPAGEKAGRCAVDLKPDQIDADAVILTHLDQRLRITGLVQAVEQSLQRLKLYGRSERVSTSRLHAYLPCRAMGTPVDFWPPKDGDPRYEGLADISDGKRSEMAAKLSRNLTAVVETIASGGTTGVVREMWRQMASEDVIAAKSRFGLASGSPLHATPSSAAKNVVNGTAKLLMSVNNANLRSATVTLRSAIQHSDNAVNIVLLRRDLTDQAFSELSGETGGRARMIAADPSALPPILQFAECSPDIDRAIFLGDAVVVLGDITDLAGFDPGEIGLAARRHPAPYLSTVGQVVEAEALNLDAERSYSLRRFAAAQIDLTAPFFDQGVCVVSLNQLRRAGAAQTCHRLMEELGVSGDLALNLWARGQWTELPWRWNANPYCEVFDDGDVDLVRWSLHPAPWLGDRRVLKAHLWRAYVAPQAEDQIGAMTTPLDISMDLDGPFEHRRDFGWTGTLPRQYCDATSDIRAGLTLREDGRALGASESMDVDICGLGSGRYAVWPQILCFSTSDNSDPNRNGRRYTLTVRNAPKPGVAKAAVSRPDDRPWVRPERPINCAIIGVGARGRSFAAHLSKIEGVTLRWLVDPSRDRLSEGLASLPGVSARPTSDALDAFADPAVQAVFIATPDQTHRSLAVAALEAGKHVFLEKPMATTPTDAWAIVQAWRASGRILQLGYVLRNTAFYKAARQAVQGGGLGRVHAAHLTDQLGVIHGASYLRRWHRKSANSGGLMVHKGCHDLDILCWLLDTQPTRVASFGGREIFSKPAPAPRCSVCPERATCPYEDQGAYEERTAAQRANPGASGLDLCVFGDDRDIVDNQVVAFELANGSRGSFSLSMQNPGGAARALSILGDKGRLDGDFQQGSFTVAYNDGAEPFKWSQAVAGEHGGGDEQSLRDFLDACLGRRKPALGDANDAMRGLVFAFAAEDARRRGAVVTISADLWKLE